MFKDNDEWTKFCNKIIKCIKKIKLSSYSDAYYSNNTMFSDGIIVNSDRTKNEIKPKLYPMAQLWQKQDVYHGFSALLC